MGISNWWGWKELNLRPTGYEPAALTTELHPHVCVVDICDYNRVYPCGKSDMIDVMSELLLPSTPDITGSAGFALPSEVLSLDIERRLYEGRRVVTVSGPMAVGKTALIDASRVTRRTATEVSADHALQMADYSDAVQNVYVVASVEDYRQRFFRGRAPKIGALQAATAIDQTIATLAQVVDDERFAFVENATGDFARVAYTLRDIALGYVDVEKSERARELGHKMLNWLEIAVDQATT